MRDAGRSGQRFVAGGVTCAGSSFGPGPAAAPPSDLAARAF